MHVMKVMMILNAHIQGSVSANIINTFTQGVNHLGCIYANVINTFTQGVNLID